jgi:carboxypeptidase C (cathepsin A)
LLLCAEEERKQEPPPEPVITQHTIELASGPLSYSAVTGLCPIFKNEEKTADLFFIAYIKNNDEERPITFVFPGGPGGAGTIESILRFGPRRLLTAGEGRTVLPPYKIIDNPETILEYTDLVFIDPVDCGFSTSAPDTDPFSLYSVEGDLQMLAQFIHAFISKAERWNSPIYLAGSSYGTLRCCGLASGLYGMVVNGLILDGCAFDLNIISSERDHSLPDCLSIPTFAATAWYHGRLWPDQSLDEVVDYARRFMYEDYAPYMLQPSRLSFVEKEAFQKRYAELIGLPLATAKKYNCRLNESIYTAEFFGAERKALGGLDTRYSGDISTINPLDAHDPSYIDSQGYLSAFNGYLQKELKTHFENKRYASFSRKVFALWNFETYDSAGLPTLLQRLRYTLLINPLMKVFVALGYYDLRTPFAAAEYSFEHLDLPSEYKKNFQFEYFEAGHGLLFDYPSLKKEKEDLAKFYSGKLY